MIVKDNVCLGALSHGGQKARGSLKSQSRAKIRNLLVLLQKGQATLGFKYQSFT